MVATCVMAISAFIQMVATVVLVFITKEYAKKTSEIARISGDNLRITTLPGISCMVTNFDEHGGFGNIWYKNHSSKPCFFWLEVRGFRVNTREDWVKRPSELTPLRREPDTLGYCDGTKRRFLQPGDDFIGIFTLDEIGSVLRERQNVAIETLLWVTGDDRITEKNDPKVLAYDPKRWVLCPNEVQTQTRVQLIF